MFPLKSSINDALTGAVALDDAVIICPSPRSKINLSDYLLPNLSIMSRRDTHNNEYLKVIADVDKRITSHQLTKCFFVIEELTHND